MAETPRVTLHRLNADEAKEFKASLSDMAWWGAPAQQAVNPKYKRSPWKSLLYYIEKSLIHGGLNLTDHEAFLRLIRGHKRDQPVLVPISSHRPAAKPADVIPMPRPTIWTDARIMEALTGAHSQWIHKHCKFAVVYRQADPMLRQRHLYEYEYYGVMQRIAEKKLRIERDLIRPELQKKYLPAMKDEA